jgi:hypothetical protein
MATEERTGIPAHREVRLAPLLIGIGVTVAIVIVILVINHLQNQPSGQELDSYGANLQIGSVKVLAADTMMAGSVTYVDGVVRNSGNRTVTALTVAVVFHDAMGQIVQNDRNQVISKKTGPLAPGDSRAFRIGFDHVAADWNRTPPDIRSVNVFVD